MASCRVLFDTGGDAVTEALSLGGEHRRATGCSLFTIAAMMRHRRQWRPDAQVTVGIRLIDHDDRRLHLWAEMRPVEGRVAAASSVVRAHIDRAGPRSPPFPPDSMPKVAALEAAHGRLRPPEGIDRGPGIRRCRGQAVTGSISCGPDARLEFTAGSTRCIA
jgi:acyl-CoA thioester hydrolase